MALSINGARVLHTFTLPLLGTLRLTQTVVVGWVVLGIVTAAAVWLGAGLRVEGITRRQALAELAYTALDDFARGMMGPGGGGYLPLLGAIFATSVVSNLISLIGFWSPTADLATELGWALVVFVLITRQKLRAGGAVGYLKGFFRPVFLLAPINLLSELFTPVSMACRHFGNILSGAVISGLLYAALTAASKALFGALGQSAPACLLLLAGGGALAVWAGRRGQKWRRLAGWGLAAFGGVGALTLATRGWAAGLPWLAVGLPALTSFYFDWFGGCVQAFIFCTLTAIFIKQAAESAPAGNGGR